MDKSVQIFSGDEWEELCLAMLQERHGALNVQKVPSTDAGDLGIDYYCLEPCVVYQCYAVEEPISLKIRAQKQQSKITNDLNKLKLKSTEIFRMLHNKQIEHWILLVPNHDSRKLNEHCAKKTAEIAQLSLFHLAPNFCVSIQDIDYFPSAVFQSGLNGLSTINFDAITKGVALEPTSTEHPPELLANLYRKLEKRIHDGSAQVDVVAKELFGDLMRRDNVLEKLKIVAPELYEKIQSSIRRRLKNLQTIGPAPASAQAIFKSQFEELCSEIRKELPTLNEDDAQMIAYGTICSWLMLCPLDFPPYQHAA